MSVTDHSHIHSTHNLTNSIKFEPQTRYPVKYALIIQYPVQTSNSKFNSTKQHENTDYREVRLPDSDQFRNPIRVARTVQNQRDAVGIPIGYIIKH